MKINEDNFLLLAAKYYDGKVNSTIEEFYEDLKRFQYIKRLFSKYEQKGDLKSRLLLNHIIILHNCFGSATIPFLFYKVHESHYSYLKTFLIFLSLMPQKIQVNDKLVMSSLIPIDNNIAKELRKI